ncbi:MAG: F0F1 ATP synthase subunit delta [Sulfurospirillaceae bacterium]|nr:F0F1 ATP synthase subunit delta [Sulfurospirillaceae bacterium]
MSGEIAKKYVNALIKSSSEDKLKATMEILQKLSLVYNDKKFINIIQSPDIDKKQKEQFVLSLTETEDKKFINFIKLLNDNDRLSLIPQICDEFKYQMAVKNNQYEAVISSDFDISDDKLKMLEENFSKKFNSDIKLNVSKEQYPGVKVEIDDLGLEISFSINRLKAQMAEHILKAI